MSRILKEEAEEDRRRRPHPPAPAAARPTLRDRTWGYLATVCEGKPATAASCYLVVVSRGPGGAQCRGDPTRTLTEGPPARRPPRAPHGGQPCGPTSRQAAPLVATCSEVPMVPSGGHGAASLQQLGGRPHGVRLGADLSRGPAQVQGVETQVTASCTMGASPWGRHCGGSWGRGGPTAKVSSAGRPKASHGSGAAPSTVHPTGQRLSSPLETDSFPLVHSFGHSLIHSEGLALRPRRRPVYLTLRVWGEDVRAPP